MFLEAGISQNTALVFGEAFAAALEHVRGQAGAPKTGRAEKETGRPHRGPAPMTMTSIQSQSVVVRMRRTSHDSMCSNA